MNKKTQIKLKQISFLLLNVHSRYHILDFYGKEMTPIIDKEYNDIKNSNLNHFLALTSKDEYHDFINFRAILTPIHIYHCLDRAKLLENDDIFLCAADYYLANIVSEQKVADSLLALYKIIITKIKGKEIDDFFKELTIFHVRLNLASFDIEIEEFNKEQVDTLVYVKNIFKYDFTLSELDYNEIIKFDLEG